MLSGTLLWEKGRFSFLKIHKVNYKYFIRIIMLTDKPDTQDKLKKEQDMLWNSLPESNRKEIMLMYFDYVDYAFSGHFTEESFDAESKAAALEELYGKHNLTTLINSDYKENNNCEYVVTDKCCRKEGMPDAPCMDKIDMASELTMLIDKTIPGGILTKEEWDDISMAKYVISVDNPERVKTVYNGTPYLLGFRNYYDAISFFALHSDKIEKYYSCI